MAKNNKQGRKAKHVGPISPLLAGVGLGLAWAALHAPGGQPQMLDLLVWLMQAAAAGVLAASVLLIGLAGIGYATETIRMVWQKLGTR